ncbi:Nose resistant to fluoxetine protein 6, partial [Stegodyphus mimosarum]
MNGVRVLMDCKIRKRMFLFSGLFFITVLHFSMGNVIPNSSQELTDAHVLERWKKIDDGSNKILQYVVKTAMPYVVRYANELKLSPKCMNHGMLLLTGLRKAQPWAFRFLDSSGKIIDGMLTGTITNFGSYDECVDTRVKNNHGEVLMNGQYCSIKFRPPLPSTSRNLKLGEVPYILRNISQKGTIISEFAKHATVFKIFPMQLGICVPSGCEVDDVEKLAKLVSDLIYFDSSVSRCQMKREFKLNTAEIISILLCSIFGSLVFVGTFMDIYSSKMKVIFTNRGAQVLMAFSFLGNVAKLLQTDNNSGTLGSLHGIRFLTIAWILLTHTYFLLDFSSLEGLIKIEDFGKSFAFQSIVNGTYAVETFFFMGGLLLSYTLVSKNRRTINIGYYILHR